MRDLLKRGISVLAMIGLVAGVAACRENEGDRPLTKQKGVYEGQEDEKLDADQLESLRTRASGQKF